MKLVWLCLLITLSACKLYVPRSLSISATESVASLAAIKCDSKSIAYAIQDMSRVGWSIDLSKVETGEKTTVASNNPVVGQLSLLKGQLNQAKGLATISVAATSTGDLIRDRLFQEVLFGSSTAEPFRLTINRLVGMATTVATGSSVEMKADATLEVGGRKGTLLLPVTISEQESVYTLKGTVPVDVRESRPAINSLFLDDKLQTLESALAARLGKVLTLTIELHLKSSCGAAP